MSATEKAVQVVLDHDAIDVASLGRLSCTSRDMTTAVRVADVWQRRYEEAILAVTKYQLPGNATMLYSHGLRMVTW